MVAVEADAEMSSATQSLFPRLYFHCGSEHCIDIETNLCTSLPLQSQGRLVDVNRRRIHSHTSQHASHGR